MLTAWWGGGAGRCRSNDSLSVVDDQIDRAAAAIGGIDEHDIGAAALCPRAAEHALAPVGLLLAVITGLDRLGIIPVDHPIRRRGSGEADDAKRAARLVRSRRLADLGAGIDRQVAQPVDPIGRIFDVRRAIALAFLAAGQLAERQRALVRGALGAILARGG